jgi:hypothetical protein
MELLDRYLQAVQKHLPWKRQEDIIAELRANLESQLDEKQAELGRSMTAAEAETWIGQLGSPLQMASRYQPQQYLIGPAIFPVYLNVLRLASVWVLLIYTLVSVINAVLGQSPAGHAIAVAILGLPSVLVQVAAWITLAFAAIEFTTARFPDKCPDIANFHGKWTPRDLPKREQDTASGKKRRTYGQALTEAIFGFLVLGWFLLVPQHPFLMFGPGVAFFHASPYRLASIWMTVYWWIVGLAAVQLAWQCFDLLRGAWQRVDRVQHIVMKILGLIPLLILAGVHDRMYLLLKRPETDLVSFGPALQQVNQGIHTGLLVLCVIVSIQLAWNIAQAILAAVRKRAAAS